jgi:hypothetical protein
MRAFGRARGLTGSDIIEDLSRLAGVLSLLACYKIGRGGGGTRARQRLARAVIIRPGGRGSSPNPGPVEGRRRDRERLRFIVVALWFALLLAIVAYAGVWGEAGLADLDAMGFAVVTD